MHTYSRPDVLPASRSQTFARLVIMLLVAGNAVLQAPALADQGCDDMRQLCKDATAAAAKCVKNDKGDERSCKPLTEVRDVTCTQAEIVCKPPVGETK